MERVARNDNYCIAVEEKWISAFWEVFVLVLFLIGLLIFFLGKVRKSFEFFARKKWNNQQLDYCFSVSGRIRLHLWLIAV